MNLQQAEAFILTELREHLSPTLYYHGIHHVLDVAEASRRLAEAEGITDVGTLALIRTAALYHDCGFVSTYQGHEEAGCRLARQSLPRFAYSPEEIETVCGMIMATRIPQTPQNLLEKIVCDADLDYLGRDDFEPIAQTLFQELKVREMVADEAAWNRIQVRFLESHRYWTPTAVCWRETRKLGHLEELKRIVSHFPA
ncbi:HD domain-containing protein [Larkinella soli]|uniref:HD domain-containing protein n=1 Tax=Larkinella soli TaxID=1770527 RepID=UPI000FFB9940|nr:HD domain-containing protein [Larkinella soli]